MPTSQKTRSHSCVEIHTRGVRQSVSSAKLLLFQPAKSTPVVRITPVVWKLLFLGQLTPVPAIKNHTCDENYTRKVKPSVSGTQLLLFQPYSHLHTSLRIITPIKIGNLN